MDEIFNNGDVPEYNASDEEDRYRYSDLNLAKKDQDDDFEDFDDEEFDFTESNDDDIPF